MLDNAVKLVNFIKARPTNEIIFGRLCEQMGSMHNCSLTHTEVKRLSRGKILTVPTEQQVSSNTAVRCVKLLCFYIINSQLIV